MRHVCYLVLLLFMASEFVYAQPFTPSSPDEVVASLASPLDLRLGTLKQRHKQIVGGATLSANEISAIAKEFIDLGKRTADPRYFSYALSSLGSWRAEPNAPLEILRQRIRIYQFLHDIDAAIADVERALAKAPADVHLLLTASIIAQDAGKYLQAQDYCDRLAVSHQQAWSLCAADLGSVTGQSDASYRLLEATLEKTTDTEARIWALALMADIAWRQSRFKVAEANFTQALALAPDDIVLLKSYADYLLDRDRPLEVLKMTDASHFPSSYEEVFLLPRCLAYNVIDGAEIKACTELLEERISHNKQRGDTPYYAEEIRFYLDLSPDLMQALALAKKNWLTNKKPSDALLLLRAANAVCDQESLAAVAKWVAASGLEDHRLDPYLIYASL